MWQRWGWGPVFVFEWLIAARRWQMYAARSVFVGLLLAALCVVWEQQSRFTLRPGLKAMVDVGEKFYLTLVGTELTLLLLAAPAATAGAICLDKARGTLLHLFITDLSDAEIVLGKLAARLVPVLGLLGCSVPIMFICTFMGGIDPNALIGAFLVMLGCAVLSCAVALVLSVWGHKTYEVLLATYLLWILVLLAYPMWSMLNRLVSAVGAPPNWLLEANPYWLAFAPYKMPGSVTETDYFIYLGTCLGVSAVAVLLAIARLRPVAIRQSSQPAKVRRQAAVSWPAFSGIGGPSLDANPVLWREWHRRRPSRWARLIWGLYIVAAVGFNLLAVWENWMGSGPGNAAGTAAMIVGVQVVVGLLLVSVSAPNPLAEERARATLDVLLTTPLSTAAIVWAKWWGTYRVVLRLAFVPWLTVAAITAFPFHWTWMVPPGRPRPFGAAGVVQPGFGFMGTFLIAGLILSYGAAFTSLGTALAVWTSRLGRAVAWNVAAYVLIAIGWLSYKFIGPLGPNDDFHTCMAMGSPFFGTGQLTWSIGAQNEREYFNALAWSVHWIGIYLFAAAVLYLATLASFNRRLGRMDDRSRLRKVSPPTPAASPR